MATRRDILIAAAAGLSPIALSGMPRAAVAAEDIMALCIHTNTSNSAGYRGALEGWAKADIRNVELSGRLVDEFLKTDTLDGARNVLTDNGLTAVHGSVAVGGLLEPNPDHATAIENLKRRLEMFASLGMTKAYTTSGGSQKLSMDDYETGCSSSERTWTGTKTSPASCSTMRPVFSSSCDSCILMVVTPFSYRMNKRVK